MQDFSTKDKEVNTFTNKVADEENEATNPVKSILLSVFLTIMISLVVTAIYKK